MAAPVQPVILSGGTGSRLWPLSRALFPKQFHTLISDRTMLQQTARRTVGSAFLDPMVICNNEHRFLVAEQLRAEGIQAGKIILEPAGRNTAPAALVAALMAPTSQILLMPSDHLIADPQAFGEAIDLARGAARTGHIVTFGIKPDKPETGYGYIEAEPGDAPWHPVKRFTEKPDIATAEAFIEAGSYFWNAGIFLFEADILLQQAEEFCPDILRQCRKAVSLATADLDFIRLEEQSFTEARSESLDYAIMEKTSSAAVVPVDMGWSDVGSWSALWDVLPKDEAGNVLQGDIHTSGVTKSYLRSDGPAIAALGLENIVVYADSDSVLVADRHAAQDVKTLVERLRAEGSSLSESHARVYRPWGWYQTLQSGAGFKVKHICVNPGGRLSLQRHTRRAEHWVVVSGVADVTCEDQKMTLRANQSTYVPLGATHRLENSGDIPVMMIEVQSGDYLEEDDIERLDDIYGR